MTDFETLEQYLARTMPVHTERRRQDALDAIRDSLADQKVKHKPPPCKYRAKPEPDLFNQPTPPGAESEPF